MKRVLRLLTRFEEASRKAIVVSLFLCGPAIAQQQIPSINLTGFGYPPPSKAWNPSSCATPYRGYHWIQWLDDQHLVVIFNTTPVCPAGVNEGSVSGNARVVVLTSDGKQEAEQDFPYVADLWQSKTPGSGLAIGPAATILVIVPGVPWERKPNADGMVRVFTRNLRPVQDIPTETATTTMVYGTFTHYGLHFEGVAVDHNAVVFSQDRGIAKPQACLLFTGVPLKQTGDCDTDLIAAYRKNVDPHAPYPLSKDLIATAFLGRSADLSLSAVFLVKDRAICDLAGAFCPRKGTLVVYQTRNRKSIFQRRYPVDAALALSPDGRRIACFLHNKVEISPVK
jgi:hypothetical protein